jgi:hypothetical protein
MSPRIRSWAPGQMCATGIIAVCTLGVILGAAAQLNLRSRKVLLTESRNTIALATGQATAGNASEQGSAPRSARFASLPGLGEPDAAARGSLVKSYGQLPLSFEANQGQTDKRVKFLARGGGYTLFLTGREAVLALRRPVGKDDKPIGKVGLEEGRGNTETERSTVLRVKLVGAKRGVAVRGEEELAGKSNYFLGNDPAKWQTNVPNYGRVKYEGVYRGVDQVYYGHQGELESDFIGGAGG